MRTLLFIILLCFHQLSSAQEANLIEPESIHWIRSDTPPFHISSGQYQGQGICDLLLDKLIKATPAIQHKVSPLPQGRIGALMDEGEKVCFPCMIHRATPTARASYSVKTTLYPPFQIITSKATASRLKSTYGGEIPAKQLTANRDFVFGLEKGRKFGPVLDEILVTNQSLKHAVTLYNKKATTTALFRMLQLGRIDYLIDYATTLQFQKTRGIDGLISLPIAEIKNDFVYGAIGCSSSAADNFADKALSSINRTLKEVVLPSDDYIQNQQFWMGHSVDNYQQLYKGAILDQFEKR